MQNELNLLPVIDRIYQITANLTAKTIVSGSSYLQNEIKNMSSSVFLNNPLMLLRKANINISELSSDQSVYTVPPWSNLALNMVVDKQKNKKDCSQIDLQEIYCQQIDDLDTGNDLIIYTDGSVILDKKGVSGSAAHINNCNNETLCVVKLRISDFSSSTQTELVAILKTLELLESSTDWKNAIIHTDSLSSILALEQRHPQDMKFIISNCQKIAFDLLKRNQLIKIHYIPSHIGILGNECVDYTAKCAALRKTIDYKISPSKSALKNMIHKYLLDKQKQLTMQETNSISIKWRKLVCKSWPGMTFESRNMEVVYHRIRLGFNTYKQLKGEYELCRVVCLWCSECELKMFHFSSKHE